MDSFTLAGELALALLAGIALNLTPCVLPAIPLKVRAIVHESGSARQQRMISAIAFLCGTLLFFLPLAVASAALHWTWGTLFQSRLVVVGLIVVLLGFAFTTYRDVGIRVPGFAGRLRGRRYFEPFVSGLLSALLAAPCTGPFLGGVLAFSISQSPAVIVAIFGAVGIGLALPYMVLVMRPSLLNRLPRAGAWSVRVRQALAFVLLAAAAFFAQSLVSDEIGPWLWGAWLALVTAWAIGCAWRSTALAVRIVGPVFAVLALAFVWSGGLIGPNIPDALAWQALTPDSWQQAQESGQPVLVEYTADWCINCKVLERTVYSDGDVARAVNDAGLVTLQADLTTPTPELKKLLVEHGGAGLPYAVVMDGHGDVTGQFSGMFSTSALIGAINETR